MQLDRIAKIYTDFPQKFGIPRQSGLVESVGKIVFEPEYRDAQVVKGIEGYSHLWLLWEFEGNKKENWSKTVHPPRLGGKETVGVFASRSPFRPNPIGLSSVRLERVEITEEGPVLYVIGADLRNETPIFDIKPYLPYTDSHPEAKDGFAGKVFDYALQVDFPEELLNRLPEHAREAAVQILSEDPRSRFQTGVPDMKYGVAYAGKDIHFTVDENTVHVYDVTNFDIKKGKIK